VPSAQPPPDKGSREWLARVPGLILGQLGFISVYGYPGVLLGALLALGGACLGRPYAELPLWLFVGIALYIASLSYYLRPDKIVERKFKLWDRWVTRKIITSNQRKEWRRELHAWYVEQTFESLPRAGKLPPLISEHATSAEISEKT
jgi:hypothetical protein